MKAHQSCIWYIIYSVIYIIYGTIEYNNTRYIKLKQYLYIRENTRRTFNKSKPLIFYTRVITYWYLLYFIKSYRNYYVWERDILYRTYFTIFIYLFPLKITWLSYSKNRAYIYPGILCTTMGDIAIREIYERRFLHPSSFLALEEKTSSSQFIAIGIIEICFCSSSIVPR